MKGWGRKIEVRDVAVAAVICALLGAVVSWLILAWVGDPTKTFGFGSLADWVAAAGTWAIGYGAWKYAREAHQLRLSEVRANEARALKTDARALLSIKSRFETVFNCADIFSKVERDSEGRVSASDLAACVSNVKPFLKRIAWSHEERSELDSSPLEQIGAIEVMIESLTEFGDMLLTDLMKSPKTMIDANSGKAAAVLNTAVDLRASAQRAMSAIDRSRDQLLMAAAALDNTEVHTPPPPPGP